MCGAPGPAAHDLARCPAWHYYIDRMGGVVRLLDEAYVARELVGRHWKGQPGLEQHALAVAVEGSTTELTAAQQVALRRLLAELMPRYGLRREHLLRAVAAAPAPSVAPALDEHPAPSEATLQQAAVGGG
jgi:N-acetyl-anhydromuramyl-L-alanine amidase AmpD